MSAGLPSFCLHLLKEKLIYRNVFFNNFGSTLQSLEQVQQSSRIHASTEIAKKNKLCFRHAETRQG